MERGEIAPEEQFLLSSTIFCYLVLDSYVKTRIRFSLRDKRLFEITEVEITRSTVVVCISVCLSTNSNIVCLCVRSSECPSVRPPVCIFLCDIVSIGLYVSVHSSVRSSVRLFVFCQYECMHVSLLSVYMTVTYPISNL